MEIRSIMFTFKALATLTACAKTPIGGSPVPNTAPRCSTMPDRGGVLGLRRQIDDLIFEHSTGGQGHAQFSLAGN